MSTTISLKASTARALSVSSLLQICLIAAGLALLAALIPVWGNNDPAPAEVEPAVVEASAEAADATPATVAAAPAAKVTRAAADTSAGESLSPRMRGALAYVAHRYKVSADAMRPVFQAVQTTSAELHLDPLLIVAVIGIESGFNPLSQSVMGAQGLMQVIPRFHKDKLPAGAGKAPLLDPVTNVRVGAKALKEYIRRNGDLVEGLQQFAGASDDEDQAYAARVLAEKQRLESAARRIRHG